jgi:hypothetical protein
MPPPRLAPVVSVPEPDPVAPADLVPAPRWPERLTWYGGSALLALVLVTCGMQLWNRDLRAPFYYDLDALLYLPLVKTTLEHGSHWRTERLGAPGQQELYDFPIIDHLHLAILWLIGRLTPDLLLVYNTYSVLTYPLTVLSAMWVLRWLKLTLPTAALGGLLYAFLPYHQERYQYHYFLAAYWWVPVSLVPALAVCKGDFPFFARRPDGSWRWNLLSFGALGALACGAVTAAAGAYYAFFACATYSIAGAYAWLVYRTWRGAASAALVIAPVVAVGLALHLPTFLYQSRLLGFGADNGVNPITRRQPEEAELYGLKVTHLLLPANDHNFRPFADLRTRYTSGPFRPAEGEPAGSLGVIGASGLLALLVLAALPGRRRWPAGPLVALVLGLILLASIGAFGSLFNLLVTAQIRAYNRVCVFVAFLSLFAVLWWLDRFLLSRPWVPVRYLLWGAAAVGGAGVLSPVVSQVDEVVLSIAGTLLCVALALIGAAFLSPARGPVPRLAGRLYRAALPIKYYPVLGALLVLGYLDQTPWGWNPINPKGMAAIDLFAERFRADKQFFKRIEEAVPPGTSVFCLPYVGFPESPAVQKMAAYEHARGYLMTDTLCWSYGAIKGREADVWQRDVVAALAKDPGVMLKRIVARGFDGLLIDARGFPVLGGVKQATKLVQTIHDLYATVVGRRGARLPEIVHEDGQQFFLYLRPFRDVWREKDPHEFADRERYEREWIAPLWLDGFHVHDPTGEGERLFWGPFDATLVLVNPTDRPRTVDLSFTIGVEVAGPFDIAFSGLVSDNFTLDRDLNSPQKPTPAALDKRYERLELPPESRSTLHIRCRPPSYFLPFDRRNLCYYIANFKLVER